MSCVPWPCRACRRRAAADGARGPGGHAGPAHRGATGLPPAAALVLPVRLQDREVGHLQLGPPSSTARPSTTWPPSAARPTSSRACRGPASARPPPRAASSASRPRPTSRWSSSSPAPSQATAFYRQLYAFTVRCRTVTAPFHGTVRLTTQSLKKTHLGSAPGVPRQADAVRHRLPAPPSTTRWPPCPAGTSCSSTRPARRCRPSPPCATASRTWSPASCTSAPASPPRPVPADGRDLGYPAVSNTPGSAAYGVGPGSAGAGRSSPRPGMRRTVTWFRSRRRPSAPPAWRAGGEAVCRTSKAFSHALYCTSIGVSNAGLPFGFPSTDSRSASRWPGQRGSAPPVQTRAGRVLHVQHDHQSGDHWPCSPARRSQTDSAPGPDQRAGPSGGVHGHDLVANDVRHVDHPVLQPHRRHGHRRTAAHAVPSRPMRLPVAGSICSSRGSRSRPRFPIDESAAPTARPRRSTPRPRYRF